MPEDMSEVAKTIRDRQSVRASFNPDRQVSREDLSRILVTAMLLFLDYCIFLISAFLKQSTRWSFTIPAACMNE
jgi:hypothetical protein